MAQKVIVIVFIAAVVVGFSFVSNFWEKSQVKTAMGETLSIHNVHTFKDRTGVEKALYDLAYDIVGEGGDPAIEIYHYVGTVYAQDIDVSSLPKTGGVQIVGDQVKLSALVGRVWWYQKILWYKQIDVQVTRAVFVQPGNVGSSYTRPPANEYDFVDEPWLLLDASR